MNLSESYRACARVARVHYENFPVASRLLPRVMRPHVAAVYAFARAADDFADEGDRPAGERYRLLDDWQQRLLADLQRPSLPGQPPETPAIFQALGASIRQCDLPIALFTDLLSAFRQDVETRRYEHWRDVLDYCRRSANPIGRLMLRIAGVRSQAIEELSDCLCTALQLANFWQDLGIDWRRGRLYVPLEEIRACRARIEDLDLGVLTSPWRAVLARVAGRTRNLFDRGRAVCDASGIPGRLRLQLRLTWLGGRRILERTARPGSNPIRTRPTLGPRDYPALLWQAVLWPRSGSRLRPRGSGGRSGPEAA